MSLQEYKNWLDLSWPVEDSGRPFFNDLAVALSWPKPVDALNGKPEAVLRLLGVTAGDYVILPNLSPLYWAAAAKALGADVILIDAHPRNWQLDLDMLEMFLMNFTMLDARDELILKKDARTIRAVVVPHLLGGLCDMDRLQFIVRRFYVTMAEDVTQALGCSWKGQAAGSFGQLGYCRFVDNPLLPFGESVVFATSAKLAALTPVDQFAVGPQAQLNNHLGRQFIPQMQEVLTQLRAKAAQLRNADNRSWMELEEGCASNGLATAFLTEDQGESAQNEREMPLPLYLQPPFDKSLYIRQENHSEKIQQKARWVLVE